MLIYFFQTCAHRYIKENSALGVCHTLDQDLAHHDMWIPCQGKPHNNYLEDFGLCQAGFSAVIGQVSEIPTKYLLFLAFVIFLFMLFLLKGVF